MSYPTGFFFRVLGVASISLCIFNLIFVLSFVSQYVMTIEQQTMRDIQSELIEANTLAIRTTTIKTTNISTESHDAQQCLVVICGSTRAWNLTYLSLFEHLLDVYHCDLALSIGDTPLDNISHPLYKRAKYIWIHNFDSIGYQQAIQKYYYQLMGRESYDEWLNKYKLLKLQHKADHFMGPLWSTPGANGVQSVGSSGIGIVNRYFTALNILKYNLSSKYKLMVYTRSDFKHMCNHSDIPFDYSVYENNPNTVYIPIGTDYDGIYDRHFVSTPNTFVTINSLLKDMIMDHKYFEALNQLNDSLKWSAFLNSEQMLKIHMERNNITIKRYKPTMYLVRGNDTSTRWREGFYSEIEQVYIKYVPEYRSALRYCYNPLNGTKENMMEFRKRMTPVHPNNPDRKRKKV